MIVTTLLCISLAIIIYSVMKGRKMMSVLLKFMLLTLMVMAPVIAEESEIGFVGVWGVPEPENYAAKSDTPIIIPISDATGEMDSWTTGALAFLNGNETLVNQTLNNTKLVIA